ncbi:amidase [Microtetraspora malaysiensis]|uniref:amidase n=1 Tax=Microtetraspora malaysiensis TaxID=161358 RepID=UPI000B297A4F|nr:amidase [Microtetraspora malaysiensis]
MSSPAPDALTGLSITDAARMLADAEVSAAELIEAVLARAEQTEPTHHAYAFLDPELARAQARQSDARRSRGDARGPVDGVPFGIKDLFLTADMPTGGGSHSERAFEGRRVDEPQVTLLRDAGVVFVGKHTTNHFGSGRCPSPARNALNPELFSGGSTSGGGVSVALGSSLGALGSDGGGSIRVPAALNGVVGYLPSFGQFPEGPEGLFGPNTYGSGGLICRTVADVELVAPILGALTAGRGLPDGSAPAERPLEGLRIGVVDALMNGATPAIHAVVERAITRMAEAGAHVVNGRIPEVELTSEVFDVVAGYEVHRGHQDMLVNHRYAYCERTLPGYLRGADISRQRYEAASAQRARVRVAVERFYADNQVDLVVGPVTGIPAVPIEGMEPARDLVFYAMYTAIANLTGQPALSVPCGVLDDGMPVGLHILGRPNRDRRMLGWARRIEAVLPS